MLISLVDESRAWFKSSIGFGAPEVPREATICSFAVLTNEPLIVPDTRLDDRFVCNPFVQCEPGMRFYPGAPSIDRDGFNLDTLCLLDTVPHDPLTVEQQATLVDLAAMVVDELELRLAAQRIAQVDAALVEITHGVSRVTGGAFFDELVRHFAKVLGTDYVYIGLVEGTEPKMMRTIASGDRGNIVGLRGTVLDITDRKQAEEALRASENRFQQLATASPCVIYTVVEDATGAIRFEYLSLAFETIHEIPIAIALARAEVVTDQIHPDDRQAYHQAIEHCMATMQPLQHEWRITTPSGKIEW